MLRVYQRVRAVAGLHGRALSGLPDIAASFPTLTFIDKESLVQTLSGPEAGKTLVVDVRQQAEVATTGRIAGAVTVAAAEDFADAGKQSAAVAAVLQAAKERAGVETFVFLCGKSLHRGPASAAIFQRGLAELPASSGAGSKLQVSVLRGGFNEFNGLREKHPKLFEN